MKPAQINMGSVQPMKPPINGTVISNPAAQIAHPNQGAFPSRERILFHSSNLPGSTPGKSNGVRSLSFFFVTAAPLFA
jgi:hypothetical protein